MKRTFVEVIMNIREGEIWENKFETITRTKGGIFITLKNDNTSRTMCFDNSKSYSLVEESVSFTEAFEAYEEGKRIKSLVGTNFVYVKKLNNKNEFIDCFLHQGSLRWANADCVNFEEIRGQWQILD